MTTSVKHFISRHPICDYVILLVIVLMAMWPLTLGLATLKWDALDLYLPWKHFITESLKSGELPLWNPSLNYGFAQMGDPGTWYPISWLIGLFGKYDLTSLNIEYLFHLWLAGAGMYSVGKNLKLTRAASILIGTSYMLSGFFIGNAQHVGWLVSAAWFPFAFLYFRQIAFTSSKIAILKFGFVLFLMLSGGYPGIFISTGYIFLFYFLALIGKSVRRKNFFTLRKLSWKFGLAAVFSLVISAVVIVSSFDLSEHLTRGTGLSESNSTWNIFHGSLDPKAISSFIFPHPSGLWRSGFWDTKIAFINCYAGILMLVCFLTAFFHRNTSSKFRTFGLLSILFMLLALGKHTPLRGWSSELPFMDLFRYPSLFRFLGIFFLLLVAGNGLDRIRSNKNFKNAFLRFLTLTTILVGISTLILLFYSTSTDIVDQNGLKKVELINRFTLQSGITFSILLMAFLLIKFEQKSIRFAPIAMMSLFVLDMAVATQLNMSDTVITERNPDTFSEALSVLPIDYPIPDLNKPMNETSDKALKRSVPFLWRNLATYQKMPSLDGFSPYGIKGMHQFMEHSTSEEVFAKPFLFFVAHNALDDYGYIENFSTPDFKKLEISSYHNNGMEIQIETEENSKLIIQQAYYPHWKSYLNNDEVKIQKVSDLLMAVDIPQGTHCLRLHFYPKNIILTFWISSVFFLLGIATLTINHLLVSKKEKRTAHLKLPPFLR